MLTYTQTTYIQLGVGREGQSQENTHQCILSDNPKFWGGVEKLAANPVSMCSTHSHLCNLTVFFLTLEAWAMRTGAHETFPHPSASSFYLQFLLPSISIPRRVDRSYLAQADSWMLWWAADTSQCFQDHPGLPSPLSKHAVDTVIWTTLTFPRIENLEFYTLA